MLNPFLFRFRQVCLSESRNLLDVTYRYDSEQDLVIDTLAGQNLPAIDSTRMPGPPTKKKDVEKGEDQKDRRMWH
jgi:hypothetical protein